MDKMYHFIAGLVFLLISFNAYAEDFGVDKVAHFGASFVVTAGTYKACDELFVHRNLFGIKMTKYQALAAGVITGILVGVGKEVYDKASGGEFSKGDLLADGFGVFAGFGFVGIVEFDGNFRNWK